MLLLTEFEVYQVFKRFSLRSLNESQDRMVLSTKVLVKAKTDSSD